MHVLLVDDDSDVRITTCLLLEHYGHRVDAACGGVVALEFAHNDPPEAVLLDLNMPGMDGFETARSLRQIPATATVLIIAVSGYVTNQEWCDRAIAAGVGKCLAKPLDYDRLDEMLRSFGARAASY